MLLGLAGAGAAGGEVLPAIGLGNGESLTYSVRWGILPSVGRIKISAETIGDVMRVTTTTATWGLARGLFAFDGRGESIYDAGTGRLRSISEWSAYKDKVVKDSVVFDYGRLTARFTDDIHPEKTRDLRMPSGDPADLILALIRTRTWNLRPGQQRDALVVFKDQFYPLTIQAEDEPDYVFTSLGVFRSIVLVPRMRTSPPIGMFKNGSTVRVWIEDNDARRLPVRFDVGFRFGTGTATIMTYVPPGDPPAQK
ncbi:MAG TPA: DUF3108 domain-containing protein [Opitutaceae bacterium]